MAFSALEKALAIAVGIDLAVPGTNRKVALAIARQLPRVAPPVARGAAGVGRAALGAGATFARRNPVVATGLAGAGLYQAGVFDPVEDAISREVERRVASVQAIPENLMAATQTPVFKPAVKRKVSKYSRAIKAGMAAVKASKFNGKKGKISNAKTTFAKVNKVASAVNKGKKVASKGVTGVIKRAVGRFL